MREACRQAGRQTDRQAKGKEREEKKEKKISISPPKHGELLALLCCTFYTLFLSLSLFTYYLTLMPFSFGVDDTSFAPFFD